MASSSQQAGLGIVTLPPLTAPYLDASVFMAHIKEEKEPCRGTTRIEITKPLLKGAEEGHYKLHTSFITIAEVRRLKEAKKELAAEELPKVNKLFADYMQNEWLVPIEVNREVAEKAQELGAKFGMSPTDAMHLASAILWNCNVLMVWDKGRFSSLFKSGPYEGVHVLEPYWEGLPKLST